jgi:hypothetical protein
MLSQMMNQPLRISSLIRHADKNHGDTDTVSLIKWHSVETHRSTIAACGGIVLGKIGAAHATFRRRRPKFGMVNA